MIQVTRDQTGKRSVQLNQIDSFLNTMSDVTISQIKYKFCPIPQLASTASVSFGIDVPENKKFKWSIFKFPLKYSD